MKPDPSRRVANKLGVRGVAKLPKPRTELPDMFGAPTQLAPPEEYIPDRRPVATWKALKQINDAMAYNVEFVLQKGATTGDTRWNGKGNEPVEDATWGAHPRGIIDAEAVSLLLRLKLIEPTDGFNRYRWTERGIERKNDVRGARRV